MSVCRNRDVILVNALQRYRDRVEGHNLRVSQTQDPNPKFKPHDPKVRLNFVLSCHFLVPFSSSIYVTK